MSTPPKGRATRTNPRSGPGIIARTVDRALSGPEHRPPLSGLNHNGNPWRGASRVRDRAAQRRNNRLTWAKEKAAARRAAMAVKA